MKKLAEKCIARDKEIASAAYSEVSVPTKYNIKITDSVIEDIMAAESTTSKNDESLSCEPTVFIPPFFDNYIAEISDYADNAF